MTKVDKLKLVVRNFRAVGKADIVLNGITVVAGENGCGKSTLSKLLYHTFRVSRDYEKLIFEKVRKELNRDLYNIDDLYRELRFQLKRDDNIHSNLFDDDFNRLNFKKFDTIEEFSTSYSDYLDKLEYLYGLITYSNKKSIKISSARYTSRFRRVLNDDKTGENLDFSYYIQVLRDKANSVFERANQDIIERNSELFSRELFDEFRDKDALSKFSISEFGDDIFKSTRIGRTNSVGEVVYIDSPFATESNSQIMSGYWGALKLMLQRKPDYDFVNSSKLSDGFGGEKALNGKVYFDDNGITGGFKYKRADNVEFELSQCATGIKAFGILQMLYSSGSLTEDTLVILDEPEVHLHPQWIVEYARMIVLLNKELGVKFFIASHNPDMVNALLTISEKEENVDSLNFYLAEKPNDNFLYDYKELGRDIDPIFESFNIALDRISQYGDN